MASLWRGAAWRSMAWRIASHGQTYGSMDVEPVLYPRAASSALPFGPSLLLQAVSRIAASAASHS